MESNIGMVDRYFRLASGLVLLGTAMTMRKRSVLAKGALLSLGAMKIAEGATGWCPLIYLADTMSGSNSSKGTGATSQSTNWPMQQQSESNTNAQASDSSSDWQENSSDNTMRRGNPGNESWNGSEEHQSMSGRSKSDSRNDSGDERARPNRHQAHRETTAHRSERSDSHRERTDDAAPLQ